MFSKNASDSSSEFFFADCDCTDSRRSFHDTHLNGTVVFVSFLMPYPIRGAFAPLLWIFYRQLKCLPHDQVHYIGDDHYFLDPEIHVSSGRPETTIAFQRNSKYSIPDASKVGGARKTSISQSIFDELLNRFPTHNHAWVSLLKEPYQPLVDVLKHEINLLVKRDRIEAVLSWGNCPSLSVVAESFGIPIIHHELGPLRDHGGFHSTAYLDFRGVNSNTEAEARYSAFREEAPRLLAREELIALLRNRRDLEFLDPPEFDIGLAFQVENDSNILAFSRGFNNLELYWAACRAYDRARVLTRQHPGGVVDYSRLVRHVDDSPTAWAFIRRCKSIATINSSVGLESALLNVPVCVLGDNPFRMLALSRIDDLRDPSAWPPDEYLAKLNFASLGYLIPDEFLFDVEYYRFRLGRPSEIEIYLRHVEHRRVQNGNALREDFERLQQKFLESSSRESELISTNELMIQDTNRANERLADLLGKQAAHLRQIELLNEIIATLNGEINRYQQELNWMKSSKFWKLRQYFARSRIVSGED